MVTSSNTTPPVSKAEAAALAPELAKRMYDLDIKPKSLCTKANLKIGNLNLMLGGKEPYSYDLRKRLEDALHYYEEHGVPEADRKRIIAPLNIPGIDPDTHEKCKAWGKQIAERQEALGMSDIGLIAKAEISLDRLSQIKSGNFIPGSPAVQAVLIVLGYRHTETMAALEDEPETPEWVPQRPHASKTAVNSARIEDERKQAWLKIHEERLRIGQAVATVRKAYRKKPEDIAKMADVSIFIFNGIEAGYYSAEHLTKVLKIMGFSDVDALFSYIEKYGIEKPEMGAVKNLDRLSQASRILRTYYEASDEKEGVAFRKLDDYLPKLLEHRPSKEAIAHFENRRHHHIPTLRTVIGLIAVLNNLDQKQPEGKRLFRKDDLALRRIANYANIGMPMIYDGEIHRMLEEAIDTIADRAAKVEPLLGSEMRFGGVGLHGGRKPTTDDSPPQR